VLRETRAILIDAISSRVGLIIDAPGNFLLATFSNVSNGNSQGLGPGDLENIVLKTEIGKFTQQNQSC
jgi:hypothetical protein